MSYLHDHDHVHMVTAMRRYAGRVPLPGTALPSPLIPQTDCPGIVLMLDQHRRRWTDIKATLGQFIVSARKGQSLVNTGLSYSHLD